MLVNANNPKWTTNSFTFSQLTLIVFKKNKQTFFPNKVKVNGTLQLHEFFKYRLIQCE